MKILHFSSKPPYPSIDGGCFASARFLETLLKLNATVKHVSIETFKHPFDVADYPEKIVNKTQPESVRVDTKVRPLPALLALGKKGSYNVNRFNSPAVVSKLKALLSESTYDIVILDSLYTSGYLGLIRAHSNAKVYLRTHNVEHELWETLSSNTKSLVKRTYLKKLSRDLYSYEKELFGRIDGILTLSAEDSATIEAMNIDTPIHTVEVALKVAQTKPDYGVNDIFHVGSMHWLPNKESVERVVKLFPKIIASCPEIRFHIAGSGWNGNYARRFPNRIVEHGFVPDLNHFAQHHGILVSPILSGSGVRIKILETLALGIPVITTTLGAKGIADLRCLHLANTEAELIHSIHELHTNIELRERTGERAQQYIQEHHDIKSIAAQLEQIFTS